MRIVDGTGQSCNSICSSGRLIVLQLKLLMQDFIVLIHETCIATAGIFCCTATATLAVAAGWLFLAQALMLTWPPQVDCFLFFPDVEVFPQFLLWHSLSFLFLNLHYAATATTMLWQCRRSPKTWSSCLLHPPWCGCRVIMARSKILTQPLGSCLVIHNLNIDF